MSVSKTSNYPSQSSNVPVRELDKKKIKALLKYGDIGKIAIRTHYSYQHVTRIIRDEEENDTVWKAAAEYLDSLPDVQLSRRLDKVLRVAS